MYLFFIALFFSTALFAEKSSLLICGVCKNVAAACENSIRNIEKLGSHFKDYHVIIYENNSTDATAQKFEAWAKSSSRVTFISETLAEKPLCRTEKIANARNKVLKEVRKKKYDHYKYLVMVDLDFQSDWPIDEIVASTNLAFTWDCISANGITKEGFYYDRLALRSKEFPKGPELGDSQFWQGLKTSWFKLSESRWPEVYSAFGGLAIYKTDTIRKFSYSGTVTKDLKKYYQKILGTKQIEFQQNCMTWQKPDDTTIAVCEHVTLHASMALKGYDTFYINPKLLMRY